jgi:hypothetical protein
VLEARQPTEIIDVAVPALGALDSMNGVDAYVGCYSG